MVDYDYYINTYLGSFILLEAARLYLGPAGLMRTVEWI